MAHGRVTSLLAEDGEPSGVQHHPGLIGGVGGVDAPLCADLLVHNHLIWRGSRNLWSTSTDGTNKEDLPLCRVSRA